MQYTLTLQDVARILGVSRERVRQLTHAGVLKPQDTPLGRLYAQEEVQDLATVRREALEAKVTAAKAREVENS